MEQTRRLKLRGLRELYLASLDWWSQEPEKQSERCEEDRVKNHLFSWRSHLEVIWRKQNGLSTTAPSDMTGTLRQILESFENLDGRVQPSEDQVTLALWGYYCDLYEFLTNFSADKGTRMQKAQLYELLAHVGQRPALKQQMADTYTIFKAVLLHADISNVDDIKRDVQDRMHQMCKDGFSAEKVALLMALECISRGERQKEKLSNLRCSLQTSKRPLPKGDTLVRVRWLVEGAPKGLQYKLTIAKHDKHSIRFCGTPSSRKQPSHILSDVLSGETIEVYVCAEDGPVPDRAQFELKVFHNSGQNYSYSQVFEVEFDRVAPHNGKIDEGVHSMIHYDLARMFFEDQEFKQERFKDDQETVAYVLASQEQTGPNSVIESALHKYAKEKQLGSRLLVKKLEDSAISMPDDCELLLLIADSLDQDKTTQWCTRVMQQKLSGSGLHAVIIHSCREEDLEARKIEISNLQIGNFEVPYELDCELERLTEEQWRTDCQTLLDSALPSVSIDEPARIGLINLLKVLKKWEFRYTLLEQLGHKLGGRMPYIDQSIVDMVWDSWRESGDADRATLLEDERKAVLCALWEATKNGDVPSATAGKIRSCLPEEQTDFDNSRLEKVLEDLCTMKYCVTEGMFAYKPLPGNDIMEQLCK